MLSTLLLVLIVAAGFAVVFFVKKNRKSDDANKNLSLALMTDKLTLLVKRFPISLLFIAGIATIFFVEINADFNDFSYKLWLLFPVGIFLSIVATLFFEDFFDALKTNGISLLVILLWAVYCFFLPENSSEISINKKIEIAALGAAAVLAIFFIPFLKKNSDREFWNFTSQTLYHLSMAYLFAIIFYGGLALALFAIDSLFSISISLKEVFLNLAVICFALFAPIYFLTNISNKTAKQNKEINYVKPQKVLALYVLAPILAIYAAILYVYLFKIIATWELPNGWVSSLISILAFGGLLVISILYPICKQEKNKVATFISRWFPLLILPLLVLMTVGIFRRIGDYGLTINRGYLLLLNLWFYGIYIYLFFTQSRHIKWILISPVVIALLTSVSVWGVASTTQKTLTNEIRTILRNPVSPHEARTVFSEMTDAERAKLKSSLEYLHKHFGKESVQPFFTDTISDYYGNFLSIFTTQDVLTDKVKNFYYYSAEYPKTWHVEGYTHFTAIEYHNFSKKDEKGITITVDNRTFSIATDEVIAEYLATDSKERDKKSWSVKGNNYILLIEKFEGTAFPQQDSVYVRSLDGYLFYK